MIRIPLPCGRIALIDAGDAHFLIGFRWYSERRGRIRYVQGHEGRRGRRVYLHRLILGAAKGAVVDHINGDGLDNRRANIRVCRQGENCRNTGPKRPRKRFKGVYRDSRTGRYYAQIYVARKCHSRSGFATEIDAARAYNDMAQQHHGEFARLNPIPSAAIGWIR